MSSCDDSPLQSKDVFFSPFFLGLSSEVQGVQEEQTPDATGNSTHANAFLKSCLKRRTKNDCGNVSFLFFVASTPTNVWFLELPARFLPNFTQTTTPDRLRRSVWVSIVLFRRNVELLSCRWMLSTFSRSQATSKCTFGTRRP